MQAPTPLPIHCAPNTTRLASWQACCRLGQDTIVTDGPTAQDAVQALLAALPVAHAARALLEMATTSDVQQE